MRRKTRDIFAFWVVFLPILIFGKLYRNEIKTTKMKGQRNLQILMNERKNFGIEKRVSEIITFANRKMQSTKITKKSKNFYKPKDFFFLGTEHE